MNDRSIHVDFRAKLILFGLAFILSASMTHDLPIILALFFLLIYLVVQGFARAGIIGFCAGVIFALIRFATGEGGLTLFLPDVMTFATLRILVVVMAAYAMVRMPPGEVSAAFYNMHFPHVLSLPVTFMLRFVPTIHSEFRAVFAAMRLRHILSLSHPLRTFEYVLIPMMIRSSDVSDRLAASAELRGIENPGPHTCLRVIRLRRTDVILSLLGLVVTLLCLTLDKLVMN
ncbi:energy-coupling factor transporter transmembrane protein EcfT [Sporolactobacillus sp. THM19-2]|jgi:energy-coupling factor transport system permease protein|uniref:energy-coupling factor transporter transmembrane component T family protein n=1 Tax=Sporolactobacillus sp. THM19-2 TaxID=2511171 RepID=UPI0010204929|nr:energy-coupling factor transporter transmembrane component T [Sporolactobacillus sp. THM19-2]RYL92620.1 energy-coupling factor transporter transmembrane protein EcfT [Sporolactobacillus sp. THM19-2]